MTYERMNEELAAIPMMKDAAGLPNLRRYLTYFNHPERKLRVIHVAGTNGKGSTCAFIESILRSAGYRTGFFCSPHLNRVNERIRINFIPCSDDEMAKAYTRVREAMDQEKHPTHQPLTYFEVMFLMAVLIFADKEPDYCIMETGLGGRLDATNVTEPIVSVITSISLDHTAILGNTLGEIAAEKAGIIKNKIPVVYMDEEPEAARVIESVAEELGSPAYAISRACISTCKKSVNYIDFSMQTRYYTSTSLRIQTTASYQMYNAALAVMAVRLLPEHISEDQIREGLFQMRWEGRMEELKPGLYIDGAHNPGAVQQIRDMAKETPGKYSLLFAVCMDKDYESMVRILCTVSWRNIYVTRFQGARAAAAEHIAELFAAESGQNVTHFDNIDRAIHEIPYSEEEPLLCIGSLYMAGEIRAKYHPM